MESERCPKCGLPRYAAVAGMTHEDVAAMCMETDAVGCLGRQLARSEEREAAVTRRAEILERTLELIEYGGLDADGLVHDVLVSAARGKAEAEWDAEHGEGGAGEPTAKIADKQKSHRLDACRYIASASPVMGHRVDQDRVRRGRPHCSSLLIPTWKQCDRKAIVEHGKQKYLAIWYPQMGGYVARCLVSLPPPDGDPEGCFDAFVWHDGEFPFDDRQPACIHHCSAYQFVEFGERVSEAMRKAACAEWDAEQEMR